MNCPKCGYGYSKVVDSRVIQNGKKRRRECLGCGIRYNCIETSEEQYEKMTSLFNKIKNFLEENEC